MDFGFFEAWVIRYTTLVIPDVFKHLDGGSGDKYSGRRVWE
jgi:hypothetical protein